MKIKRIRLGQGLTASSDVTSDTIALYRVKGLCPNEVCVEACLFFRISPDLGPVSLK